MTERTEKGATSRRLSVADVCENLEQLAPLHLAQSWDNVGLLAGDREAAVRRVLFCIDLTPAVVAEAIDGRVELLVAYHPPIFKPVNRLVLQSRGAEAALYRCVAAGISVYSMHTALDAADEGTNDTIAKICGVGESKPIEYAESPLKRCKLVVFVPAENLNVVSDAVFSAGAGHIGDYSHCSFRIPGRGTFLGGDSTQPVIGESGRLETVEEIRLEVVTDEQGLPGVVSALRKSHPYEEPAFDVYSLAPEPRRGIGRVGNLPEPTMLSSLARKLKNLTAAANVAFVGDAQHTVSRAVICVGAAGSLPFSIRLTEQDVIITGEIRHHDALTIRRCGCTAIALGHWSSERPVLEPLAAGLMRRLPKLDVIVSEADCDPFAPV